MSGERSLPEGWIVRQSKTYPDKVYYFNVETGASIWEHPECLNSNLANEIRLKIASSRKDDEFPSLDIHNDPRIEYLEKKMFERLTKTLNSDQNQGRSQNRAQKPSNIPTAVVTPVLFDKDIMYKRMNNLTPFASYKKLACAKHDPRLFRHNCVNNDESESSSPLSDDCQNYSNPGSNQSTDISASDSSHSDRGGEFLSPYLVSNPLEQSINQGPGVDLFPSPSTSSVSENTPVAIKKRNKPVDYYFVVDTNVLVGDLRLLTKIFNSSIGKNNVSHIFIPWVVIQEIDNLLRQNSKESKLYHMANACRKFINNMVKKKDPRFLCQTVQQVKDWALEYSEYNDDRLIECCTSLSEKMPNAKVILVTNDLHLNTKGQILGITIYSIKDLVLKLDFLPKSLKQLKARFIPKFSKLGKINFTPKSAKQRESSFTAKFSKQRDSSFTAKSTKPVEKKILMNRKWSSVRLSLPSKTMEKKEKSQVMSEAFLELKNVLHPFLIAELQKVYGDGWRSLNFNLSSMKSILKVIVQHWESIFKSSYSNKVKRNFVLLQTKFKNADYSGFTKDDYLNTLTAIEDVFCDIKRRCPSIDVNIENIQDMRVACIELFAKDNAVVMSERDNVADTLPNIDMDDSLLSNDESVNDSVNHQPTDDVVLRVFEHNWTVINHLCGMIADFYGVPHTLKYEKPTAVPSSSEFKLMIHKLSSSVGKIQTIMRKIVDTDSSLSSLEYEKLASILLDFVPSLQIETGSIDTTDFNASSLTEFCQSASNSETLAGGYKQLEIYSSTLEESLVAMTKVEL